MTLVDRPGEPTTFGQPQRAAGVEAQLLRGDGVHAADTIIDHGCFGSLLVRAASVRGTYARYQSGPREDDYTMGAAGDGRWLVVALADGVTSASASHLAATLAVRTAVQQVQRQLDEDPPGEVDLHGVFQSAAYQLRRSAEPLLEGDGLDCTADHIAALFATTLLVAIVPADGANRRVWVARVGDSNAWTLGDGGWTPLLAPKAGGAPLASSAVRALPRLPEAVEVVEVDVAPGRTLVLASDGVTDPFGPTFDGDVARFLAREWHPELPAPLEFARQLSFRGQSWDDDRTAIAITGIGAPAT